ncbi:MAG: sigma 54-interacting transcriptional regulator [Syntrophobacteraceae bacterium]|nr:sigma 54-interacting transcriptional regulator [Syntrophobacteraceae bacterium]
MKNSLSVIAKIVEWLPSALVVVNRSGVIATMNSAACRLLDIPRSKAEGKLHSRVIPGSLAGQVLADAKPLRYHLSLPNASLWALATPLFEESGELCGVAEYYENWSRLEALATEVEQLREHNRFLESILNAAHQFVAAVDSNGFITYMSEETAARMGVEVSAVIGQPIRDVRSDCLLQKVVRTGVAQMGELWNVNNTSVPVMVLPMVREGQIVGAVGKSVFRNMEEARVFLRRLESESRPAGRQESKARYVFGDIVGDSGSLLQARELARRAASGESTVLLLAESGCGKELFAHAIHSASNRREGPFVSINCASIPESLLESELFGYEDGAFTGARKGGRVGKFELANGGAIFLDEIGDMSPFMQAKLLRVLQEGEVQRIGAEMTIRVNVRVIAATNADLRDKIRRGEFRKDLYYRLEGISVRIPPLRERPGDVDLLINHLLPRAAMQAGKIITGMDDEVRSCLNHYEWPGNVRELLKVIEGSVCLASQPIITWRDIPPHFAERLKAGSVLPKASDQKEEAPADAAISSPHRVNTLPTKLEELQKTAIQEALGSTNGNKRRAALLLGMSRSTFYEKLKRYGILASSKASAPGHMT